VGCGSGGECDAGSVELRRKTRSREVFKWFLARVLAPPTLVVTNRVSEWGPIGGVVCEEEDGIRWMRQESKSLVRRFDR
jgi:hypothetical protein